MVRRDGELTGHEEQEADVVESGVPSLTGVGRSYFLHSEEPQISLEGNVRAGLWKADPKGHPRTSRTLSGRRASSEWPPEHWKPHSLGPGPFCSASRGRA